MRGTVSAFLGLALALSAWGQSDNGQNTTSETKHKTVQKEKTEPSPGRQMANGAGNVAGGAAKGAGSAAKGVGKGAADLVTLHPVDGATSVGKGAAGAGKDAGVGAVKGTAKVTKGLGRAIKHLF
jgi:hypothetical protein